MSEMIILRGIPGAGKSTYVKKLTEQHNTVDVVSADHYFTNAFTGAYDFRADKLGEAHTQCFRMALHHVEMLKEYNVLSGAVIVDNTNIEAWEIAPYVMLANAYNLPHRIVTINCPFFLAAERNVHGVPLDTVRRMAERIALARLPPFWVQEWVDGYP